MHFWFEQCLLTFAAIFIFSLCGLGVSALCFAQQRERVPYWLFTAPLFGAATLLLPIIVFYDAGLSLLNASLISVVLMMVFSLINLKKVDFSLQTVSWLQIILVLVLSVVVANLLASFSAFHAGGPYIMFHDGTDTLGYANNADWLRDHLAKEKPTISASFPYDTLPSINLAADHRLGTYLYLALIAEFARVPALFAYSLAVTIYLPIAVLGLAACVATTRRIFTFTAFALLTTAWFQLPFNGFLGKFLVLPVIFSLLILVVRGVFEKIEGKVIFALMLLLCSLTSLYPYMMSLAIFLGAILACLVYYVSAFVLRTSADKSLFAENYQLTLFLLALCLFCFATSDGFAVMWRQAFLGGALNIPAPFKPWELAFKLFTIKYFSSTTLYGSFRSYVDCSVLIIAIILQVVLCMMAFLLRARAAFILLSATLLMIVLMQYVMHNTWSASQLAVLPYFSLVLGGALLLQHAVQCHSLRMQKIIWCLLILSLLMRVTQVLAVIHRDILTPPAWAVYQQSEYMEVEKIVGDRYVLVNTKGIFDSQPFFLKFGRDKHPAAFTQQAWDLTNWGLPLPHYATNYSVMIISKAEPIPEHWQQITETKHYKILKLS